MQDTLRMRHLKHLHVDAHVFMQACVLCARAVSVYPHVCTCVCVCVFVCVCVCVCTYAGHQARFGIKTSKANASQHVRKSIPRLGMPYMCPTCALHACLLCMPYALCLMCITNVTACYIFLERMPCLNVPMPAVCVMSSPM